jgi:hypothetical protein
MATVTKGRTFVSGEVVTPTKLNNLVDLATVTQIVNADISATAAIADSKLATIATAGKVSGNAITSGTIGGTTAINTTGTITAASLSGPLSGAVTGNASSATRLANARAFSAIGDVTTVSAINFDGTAAVALNLAVGNGVIDNLNIAAAAGIVDTKLATISTAGKVSGNAITSGTIGGTTAINTTGTITAASLSGPLSGAVTGNASSATRLANARAFSAIGDVTTVSAINFDGTAEVALNLAVGNGVIDNLNIAAAAGIVDTKLATISTAGKVSGNAITSGTIGGSTAINTTGTITAASLSGPLSGNATTATTANAIADGAVSTAAKIANGVVTLAKLGSTEQDLVAKCWINFNGDGPSSTAAIRSQHNVSSVTYNGLGDYTVNFANNMSNASYAVVLGGSNNPGGSPGTAMIFSTATSQVRIWQKNTVNTAFFDGSFLCVAIFGN